MVESFTDSYTQLSFTVTDIADTGIQMIPRRSNRSGVRRR